MTPPLGRLLRGPAVPSLFVPALLCASLLACGGEPPPDDRDASRPIDGAWSGCARDEECDDGVYCNGVELCLPLASTADARGCTLDRAPCGAAETCDESLDRCVTDCAVTRDADGDGVEAMECGGRDCDDSDPARSPRLVEVCDRFGVDEDCDPTTIGDRDADEDGYVSAACCNGESCGPDCDDLRAGVHPDEAETCNGVDDDCNGAIDEGVLRRFTIDADRDGHGSDDPGAETREGCELPGGFAENADDCDDEIGSVHPGAFDACEGDVDEDCSGAANDPPGGCECTGGSRSCPLLGACGASTQTCVAGRWAACAIVPTEEICNNGLDEDCDGTADDGCTCEEPYRFCGTDVGACMRGIQTCATDGSWGPCTGATEPVTETCDSIDEDCDGTVDEGVFFRCFTDPDGDGWAVPTATFTEMCRTSCPSGTTARDPATERDCHEGDARAHPGQTSSFASPRPDGSYDFDCDGVEENTEFILTGCLSDRSGRCVFGGGVTSRTLCGGPVDRIYCATMGGSSPWCQEVWRCSTSSTDCGDENRTHCR